MWKVGVVTKLHTGDGEKVRSVLVKTTSGILNRPIQRLYPLEAGRTHDTGEMEPETRQQQETSLEEQELVPEPAAAGPRGEDVENPQVGATNEPRSITTRRGRPVRLPAYQASKVM
jgi:Family of unknown function (DUF5641)